MASPPPVVNSQSWGSTPSVPSTAEGAGRPWAIQSASPSWIPEGTHGPARGRAATWVTYGGTVGGVVEDGEVGGALPGDGAVVPQVAGRGEADVLHVAVGDDPPAAVPEEERVVVAVDGVDGVDAGQPVMGLDRREEQVVGAR